VEGGRYCGVPHFMLLASANVYSVALVRVGRFFDKQGAVLSIGRGASSLRVGRSDAIAIGGAGCAQRH
jgi:hypothetical protein